MSEKQYSKDCSTPSGREQKPICFALGKIVAILFSERPYERYARLRSCENFEIGRFNLARISLAQLKKNSILPGESASAPSKTKTQWFLVLSGLLRSTPMVKAGCGRK